METSIHYGLAEKQLCFRLRERISTPPGVELKGKGWFNTATGSLSYIGTMKASASVGQENKDAGSTPLRVSGGVFVQSADSKVVPKPLLHVAMKKTISLFDGPRTVASVKAYANMDPQNGQLANNRAVVKVSHKWLNFTKRQDLKFTAGLDLDWPVGARDPHVVPFAQVRENNWAVNYRQKSWYLTYDL